MREIFFLGLMLLTLTAAVGNPLPAGESILNEKGIEGFQPIGDTGGANKIEVLKDETNGSTLVRMSAVGKPATPWALQLAYSNSNPIEKGDVVLIHFKIRAHSVKRETGEAQSEVCFEKKGGNWDKLTEFPISVGSQWVEIDRPFVSSMNLGEIAGHTVIRGGFEDQSLDVADLRITNFKKSVDINDLPATKVSYAGREPDAAWRTAAAERIEKNRKGDLTVTVTGADGKPIEGATVSVKMQRHAFGFGSAVTTELLLGTSPDAKLYQAIVEKCFNKVTFENDMKWPQWEEPGRAEKAMEAVKWLADRKIAIRGHNLIWPSWKWSPKDLKNLKNDEAALKKRINDHITSETTALAGKIADWDVVNEPFQNHDVQDIVGHDVLVDWFKLAKAADPNAKLYINDFGILSSGGRDQTHQDSYFNTIKNLIDKGAPLEGIGEQGHFGSTLTPPPKLLEILDRFATFNLPIQSTEFDIKMTDEELQADYTRDFMTTMFSHPSVDAIIAWGFWEGRHWVPEAAFYRKDWSMRPAARVWLDLVFNQWWTNTSATTDSTGVAKVRGFLGDYEIEVKSGDKTATITTPLPKDGANVQVKL